MKPQTATISIERPIKVMIRLQISSSLPHRRDSQTMFEGISGSLTLTSLIDSYLFSLLISWIKFTASENSKVMKAAFG
jgi:hypothetical protein